MCRAEIGWGVSHVEAFSAWIAALRVICAAEHMYVVFDNKRGGSGQRAVRKDALPSYLDQRHRKERQHKAQQRGQSMGRGAGRGDGAPAAHAKRTGERSGKPGQQGQQPGAASDLAAAAAAAAALAAQPPSHLAPFVAAVRAAGGLALFGLPGYEADDMIASLAAGLLTARARPADSQIPNAALATADPVPPARRIVVASGDADMLQLLSDPRVAWLQLRGLSSAAAAQEPPPLAVSSVPLPRLPPALLRLHVSTDAPASGWFDMECGASREDAPGEGGPSRPSLAEASASANGGASLLPPAAYPDYLALVGKPEAGVPGVGLSARSARRLLLKYCSLDPGVAGAVAGGQLDASLRPAAPSARSGRVEQQAEAGEGGAAAAASASGAQGGASGGGRKGGGSAAAAAPATADCTALERALLNLRVTRMYCDPGTVAWGAVGEYVRQRAAAAAAAEAGVSATLQAAMAGPQGDAAGEAAAGAGSGEAAKASQSAAAGAQRDVAAAGAAAGGETATGTEPRQPVVGGAHRGTAGPAAAASAAAVAGAAAAPRLHPQDALHARSATPYGAALAAALHRMYGSALACAAGVVDEQGRLADLVVVRTAVLEQEGGGGAARVAHARGDSCVGEAVAEAAGDRHMGLLDTAAGVGVPLCGEHAAAALAEVLATASGAEGGAGKRGSLHQGRRGDRGRPMDAGSESGHRVGSVSGSGANVEGGEELQRMSRAEAPPGPQLSPPPPTVLRVLVLSPWDFDTGKVPAAALQAPPPAAAPALLAGQTEAGEGRGPRAARRPSPSPAALRLLALARHLSAAAGPRRSPLHTPPALQALLRPSSAWRLKTLQRVAAGGAGGPVAVVPFYDLLLPDVLGGVREGGTGDAEEGGGGAA